MFTSVRSRKSGTEVQFVRIWSSEAKGIKFASSAMGACEPLGSTTAGLYLGLTSCPVAPYSGKKCSAAGPDRAQKGAPGYVPIKSIAANWQATACRM